MKNFAFKFRRKLLIQLLKGCSLTSMMFVFQACYGSPKSFGLDVCIEGVVSSETGEPIKGVIVQIDGAYSYETTDSTGHFRMYDRKQASYKIQVVPNGLESLHYIQKDTSLICSTDSTHLTLNVALTKKQQ